MAMVVSTGLRPAALVASMVVGFGFVVRFVVTFGFGCGCGFVDLRDRDRRRGDDRRGSRGCRRWERRNGRDGRGGDGRRVGGGGRWRRRAPDRWRRLGPGSANGPRGSGRCVAARNRANDQQTSDGCAGGDSHGRRLDERRRDDGRLHGARGTRRWRRPGGGPNRCLGAPSKSARDSEREDGEQRRCRDDRPAPGVTSPRGRPDRAARGRGRRGSVLRSSLLARRCGTGRSARSGPRRRFLLPEGHVTDAINRVGSTIRRDGGEAAECVGRGDLLGWDVAGGRRSIRRW